MTEQQMETPELLGALIAKGMGPTTHHSRLKKAVAEVVGFKPSPDDTRAIRQALAAHITPPPLYRARRRFRLLGHNYMPGEPVDLDVLKPATRKLLLNQRRVVRGADHG